uniref:Uncharacterized protein n=1 Tax=Arundo donax TaxID=35708 RepID=A0A0A9BW21_ARUDO
MENSGLTEIMKNNGKQTKKWLILLPSIFVFDQEEQYGSLIYIHGLTTLIRYGYSNIRK